MAPQKRARREGDESDVIMSASSSLLHDTQRKKVRLSVNGSATKFREVHHRSNSTSSSDDDDPSVAEADDEPAGAPASTQYEILRDNDFKHLQNPDLDDQRATQLFLRRRGQIGQNRAADNAIIEEITCVNFMCHTRLHVELGPLINFIVGMNGSGKSAVLTAITLCLGGKASATNRGASLKSLIKQGENQAILTVKLKNEGSDAYQPDLFGDSIIVERHFSTGSSSGYRLKNATGRTISTKKGDVDDIIEYFQLQVDNPMNVLTQDAAKSFIQNSTPASKYKFFVEGVQLQQLDNDYRLVSDTCDAIQAKLDEAESDIKILKTKSDAAKQKAQIVEQHKEMKNAARRIRNQLAWAQVEEQEADLAQRETKITALQQRINQAEGIVNDKDRAFQLANEAMENAEASVQRLEEDFIPLKEEEEAAKTAYDDAATAVQTAHAEQRQIKQSITAAQRKAMGYEADIKEENRRIEDANDGAHSRKLAEIEEARQAAIEAKEAMVENEAELPRLVEKHRKIQDDSMRAEGPLGAKRKEIDDCQKRLQALKNDRVDPMAGYHRNMRRLLQTIGNDGGFRQKPVGPIGLHIKLLKPEWSHMIETVIGNILNGFVVTSKSDQMKLSSIMRQVDIACPILIGNNQTIDTTGHEPDPQFDTILRVLDIDDDLVRRQLIINQGIEQSILVQQRTDAVRIMYSGSRPKNVRQCFTKHDSRRDYGTRLGFQGQNNEDMSGVQYKLSQKPRMKTDIESQVNLQNEMLNQLQREKSDLENRINRLRQEANRCEAEITQHKRNHGQLKVAYQRAEQRVDNLQSELDKDNVEDGKLGALQEALAEAQTEEEMYKETYRNSVIDKDKLTEALAAEKRELDAVKLRIADHEAKVNKARTKFRNTKQARGIVLSEKNVAIDFIAQLRGEISVVEDKRNRQAAVVEDYNIQASGICQRVPVPEGDNAKSLDIRYNKLKAQITSYNRRIGGSDDEIYLAYEEAQRVYETAETYFKEMSELLHILKQSFLKRIQQFRRFQQHISARSRINFNYTLSERAFRGKLSIDHRNKKLDVHVEPDETTKSSKGRQTKTLSGGEKSFSSICLLLSLWEAMGAPLRCLDEFDVFMDDVNRDVSTRMIISAARRSTGRQYIMITPKALGSGAADAEDVKIIKLFDPREKQKRINEMLEEDS